MTSNPTVLVVDDDEDTRAAYSHFLSGEYEIITAVNGEDALDKLNSEIDVILLDRRMPRMPGEEVLDRIRAADGKFHVAMVTAVETDFDIVDMEFDDYLVKPATYDELRDTIDGLYRRSSYDKKIQQFYTVSRKWSLLLEQKSQGELDASKEFNRLNDRKMKLEEELDEIRAKFTEEDYRGLFSDIRPISTASH